MRALKIILPCAALLSACGGISTLPEKSARPKPYVTSTSPRSIPDTENARKEIIMFSLGLMDTGYRFGGKNPEAGLDCSGLITYVYGKTTNFGLKGNARHLAERGSPISKNLLQPGDLVFFNTRKFSFSHVGIYVGDNRLIHASSSRGVVRINSLDEPFYLSKFEAARTFFPIRDEDATKESSTFPS